MHLYIKKKLKTDMYLFVDIKPEDVGTLECNVLQKIWDKNRLVRYDSVAKLPFSIQIRG